MSKIYRKEQPCGQNPNCGNQNRFSEHTKSTLCDICDEVVFYERESLKSKSKSTAKNKKIEQKKVDENTVDIKIGFEEREGVEVNNWYHEDNMKTMSRMPDGFVDYIFTSPPYNIVDGVGDDKYLEYFDKKTEKQYYEFLDKFLAEALRVTKKHVFINLQQLTGNLRAIKKLEDKYKYFIKDELIWNKKRAAPAIRPGVLNRGYEKITIYSNDRPHMVEFTDSKINRDVANIFEIKMEVNKYAKINRAVFPIDLPRKFMLMFGNKGDIWYDPFGGTFTTACAAIMEERRWIISEQSKSCCKAGSDRIKQYGNQLKIE